MFLLILRALVHWIGPNKCGQNAEYNEIAGFPRSNGRINRHTQPASDGCHGRIRYISFSNSGGHRDAFFYRYDITISSTQKTKRPKHHADYDKAFFNLHASQRIEQTCRV